ncbi:hypothetical protein PG987_000823 [Apiospora arundinis]
MMSTAAASKPSSLPLELPARQAKVVRAAIEYWASNHRHLVSPQLAAQLLDSVEVRGFPWDTFAKYTLRLAVICLVIAVFSALFDEAFARFWNRVRDVPASVRSLLTAVAGSVVHLYAYYRQHQEEKMGVFANEALHGVGALLFALAAVQLLDALDKVFKARAQATPDSDWVIMEQEKEANSSYDNQKPPPYNKETQKAREMEEKKREQLRDRVLRSVILLLAAIYGLVALLTGSNFIWSCAMVVMSYWFGAITCYFWSMYSVYMESPARFVGLGGAVIGTSYLMREHPTTAALWTTTRIWGLLFLFVALWIQSICHSWSVSFFSSAGPGERLRHFLHFCAFFLAAGVSIWHGLRHDDATTKGFGLAFLGINLYTKFWEFCWGWYKPLFFAVLAGTFAMVGKFAEELWHMPSLARLAA